eukprot:COSAG06_NODE_2020_length_7835_cov_3.118795_3_plen_203_part_00
MRSRLRAPGGGAGGGVAMESGQRSQAREKLDEVRRKRIAERALSAASRVQQEQPGAIQLVLETPVQRMEDAAEEQAAAEFRVAQQAQWTPTPQEPLRLEPAGFADDVGAESHAQHTQQQQQHTQQHTQWQQETPNSARRRQARQQRQLALGDPPAGESPGLPPQPAGATDSLEQRPLPQAVVSQPQLLLPPGGPPATPRRTT